MDRTEAADNVVNVLIENGYDAPDIREAFKGDPDIRQALSGVMGDDEQAQEEEDYEEYDDYEDDF